MRLAPGFDVILSSLMTHHMEEPEIVRFIAWMEATATRGWFVNDLYRGGAPYVAFKALASVARWHRFVQHDGACFDSSRLPQSGLAACVRGGRCCGSRN